MISSNSTCILRLFPVLCILALFVGCSGSSDDDGFLLLAMAEQTVSVVYVDRSQTTNPCDGENWDTAYVSLQDALINAPAGSEIWVAQGRYTLGDTREVSFTLKEGVGVYGGFIGDENFRDERDCEANETILSGDIGTLDDKSDNCYHVVTGADNAILDGFIITGGNADRDGVNSDRYGGGMSNNNSSPTVTNCTFSDNSADYGGGMFNSNSSSPIVTNCTFSGNSADYGGGMRNTESSPTVTNCTFSDNSATYFGGGMRNTESDPTVTNCTFSNNSASTGGGMGNDNSSDPTVTNCILWGNTATLGNQIYNSSSSPTITCSCIEGGGFAGEGVINVDPLLNDDLTLKSNSPCIDTGDDVAVPDGITEGLDGNPRISGDHVDMGAYEYQQ